MGRGRTHGLVAALALTGLVLAACAAALAAQGTVEKIQLAPALEATEEVVNYDRSRLLLIAHGSPSSITRVQADGSPDRSFGDGGRVETDYFADAIVAPDGKVLLAGSGASPARPDDRDGVVTRLLPDGRLDRAFGQDGRAYVDMGGRYDGAAALAIDERGRIVVGGSKQTFPANRGGSDARPTLARLLPGGALDRSFADGGVNELPGGSESGVLDVAATRRGGVVAEGEAYIGTAIWKLGEAGNLDRRFGDGGEVTVEGRGRRERYGWEETLEAVDRIGVRPDDRILLAGTGSIYGNDGTQYRLLALRLRPDGSIDRSYGRKGYATARFAGWTFVDSVAMLPRGGLVAAVDAQGTHGKRSDLGAIALRPDGRLDRRFGRKGKLKIPLPGWSRAEDVAVQAGRAVLYAGVDDKRDRWLFRAPLR
jgi:uncharacterized delta-60 repeat protein